MKSRRSTWLTLACLLAWSAVSAVAAHAGVSDAWITAKVKTLLLNSPSVSGMPINVDTDEGRVTLHGKVETKSEKTEAGRIALAGTGVTSVRNLLQVVPKSGRKMTNATDDRIQADVDAVLKTDPALSNSPIHAKSVNKGVVVLAGKAATLSDHLLAIEVSSEVAGVRQVASEVNSPTEFGDREVWYDETPGEAPAGNSVTDGWITTQTKVRFMTDPDVPGSDINVDTYRGVVTLFGTVPNSATATKAVASAKEVTGVHSVKNELRVVAPMNKKSAMANDADTEKSVRRRLDEAKLEGAHITVEVKASTARLTGTVVHPSQRYAAVAIARGTPGVARVQNDLRLDVTQTSSR